MGIGSSVPNQFLIEFNILYVDLKDHITPELILNQLITDIKRNTFIDRFEIISLMERNGRKYFEWILLLNESKF